VDLENEYLKGTVTKKVDLDDFECAGGGARENVGEGMVEGAGESDLSYRYVHRSMSITWSFQ
jgi:hypothetical protein